MSALFINTIYPTIQGEGILTGTPMILVRLQGCSVGCSFCDSKETWADLMNDEPITTDQILHKIKSIHKGEKWILITGGEPTEQNFLPLLYLLQSSGFWVALETAGTGPHGRDYVKSMVNHVCLSPKHIHRPDAHPHPYWVGSAHEIKWVICRPEDLDMARNFQSSSRQRPECQHLLQPVSNSPHVIGMCVEKCREWGWRLSMQIHKMIGLP